MNQTKVLFFLAHHNFYDDQYSKIKRILEDQEVKTEVCSSHLSEAQGRFKTLVNPDCVPRDVEPTDYDAFVFIGGDGAKEFYHDYETQDLIRKIVSARKIIVLVGEAVPALYYAGVIAGKRVTTIETLKHEVEAGGAYFTGKGVEQDGDIITVLDVRSCEEASKTIIRGINWQRNHKGYTA